MTLDFESQTGVNCFRTSIEGVSPVTPLTL